MTEMTKAGATKGGPADGGGKPSLSSRSPRSSSPGPTSPGSVRPGPSPRAAAREERLAAALKANLRRRKAQARGKARDRIADAGQQDAGQGGNSQDNES